MNSLNTINELRNKNPFEVFNSPETNPLLDLSNENIEIDYAGSDVTTNSFLKLLTNRQNNNNKIKRLNSNNNTNVMIYLTGHGGNQFLKFQDTDEMSATDLASAVQEMYLKRRYKQLLFIVDTCQASTLGSLITAPDVTIISSSLENENSYSYFSNEELGVAVIDRFTYAVSMFLKEGCTVNANSNNFATKDKNVKKQKQKDTRSLNALYRSLSPSFLRSHPHIMTTNKNKKFLDATMGVSNFFGNCDVISAVKYEITFQ